MHVKEKGKIKDVGLLEVTPENFIVPDDGRHLYHCRIEVKKFNPETGERLSKPRMQVFGKKFFETFGLHNLRQQGYTVDILYDPNEWLKANKEKAAATAAAKDAARLEAMKAAMKAEILAELKESGLLKEQPGEEKEKKVGVQKD